MTTTIQITEELQLELKRKKLYQKETYEEVIWDLIEDTQELSEETIREIEEAREEIKKGKIHNLSDIKKELGL
jgi:hypothetical protein